MPPVIVAAGVFLQGVGIAVATAVGGLAAGASIGIGAAVALGGAVVAGAALVATKAVNSLFAVDMPKVDSDASRQRTVKSTTEPFKTIYGETLVSGPITYIGMTGSENEDLYHVIALAGHEVTDIRDVHFDNKVITNAQINSENAAGGNVIAGDFGPKGSTASTICVINKHRGTATQAADTMMTGAFGDYTSAHQGKGVAYIAMKWTLNEDSAQTWEQLAPTNIKAIVKGRKVYDPRLDVAANNAPGANPANTDYIDYSTNPALCLADYLINSEFGLGVAADKVDWPAIVTAADGCDVSVTVPGGTETRFTCNGVLFGTDSHRTNINKILSSMNGTLVYTNGEYILRAGIYEAPAQSLNEDDLIGAVGIKTSFERSDRFNTVKGVFVDPAQNHKSSEFPKVQLAAALSRDNALVLEKEMQFPMTNSSFGAQRLAHKLINKTSQQKVITFPANLGALRIIAGDRVNVSIEELSWSNKIFQCVGWTFADDGGVNLTLREDDQDAYDDPASNEYSTITATGDITDAFRGVPAPSGLSAVSGEAKVFLNWQNPARPSDFGTVEVYASTVNDRSNSTALKKIGETDGTQFVHDSGNAFDPIIVTNVRYYWIRCKKNVGADADRTAVSDFSTGTTSGVSATVLATAVNWSNVANPTIGVDLNADDSIKINLGDASAETSGNAVATSGIEEDVTITQGGIRMNQGGSIRGGQTSYNSGEGFFLGYDSNKYKLSVRTSTSEALTFDGSNLSVTGNITATSGTFTGTVNASAGAFTGDVSTSSKFVAGSGATSATMDGADANYKFYAGAAALGDSPFKIDANGGVTASRIVITRPDDPSAVIFDSAQDGLVGVGLSSLSAESDNAVAQVADELTSNTDYARLILSTTQTLTVKVLFPLNYLPFAISSAEDFPDSITLKLQKATITSGTPGTFSDVNGGTKTFTRRVYNGSEASNDNYYSVNDSGTGWYIRDRDGIDAQFNLSMSDASVYVAGDTAVRVQVSYVAGSGSTSANPSASSNRTLYFNSATQYFTIDDSSIIRDQAPGSLLTGDVILSASSGARSISWRDSDTYDENWSIEGLTGYGESGSGVLYFKFNNGSTSPIAFVDNGNVLIGGDFYSGAGAVTTSTASFGGGYGSTGTSISADGNISTDGNVIVGGDLTVNGTTTTVNTDNLTVKDNNITLNYSSGDSSSTANNAGITVQDAVNSTTDATLLWKTATDTFEFSHPIKAQGNATFTGSVTSTALTTTNSGITLQSGSTTKSAINVAAATNQGINGTVAGDQYNWTTGGKMLWSTNSGTTAHLVLDSSGNATFSGSVSSTGFRFGNTSVGTEDDNEYLMSTGGQLIIRANDSAADDSYAYLILDSGNASGASSASAGVMTRTNGVERFRVGGDGTIKFFEDTGTTAKLVWSPTSEELQFADNVKATFGAGDLKIYHDGNHSYIEDAGTGAIKIKVGDFRVENASGSNLIKGVGDVATLHHAGSEKLATTSTGIQVTGNIATANGSTSAPAYSFTNDTDTGMFLNGAGYLALTVAGSKQLELGGGIIYTGSTGKIRSASNSGTLELSGGGSTVGGQILLSGGGGDGNIIFKTSVGSSSASERARITSDGKFGLGTASVDSNAKLQIEDSANPNINIDRNSSLADGNHIGYINFQNNGDVYGYMGVWVESASGTAGKLVFGTQNGTSATDKLTISASGNATFSGSVTSTGLTANGSVSVSPDTAGKNTFQLTTNASNDARLLMRSDTTTKVDIQANGASYFNGGNVGIGVTSVGEKLHVKGTGRFENSHSTPVSVHINSGNNDYGQIFASTASAWKNLVINQYGGNVAIGHTAGTAILDVRRGDASGKIAEFHNNVGYGVDIGSSTAEAYISSGYNQSLLFKTDATSGQVERMRIMPDGAVVINALNGDGQIYFNGTHGNLTMFLAKSGLETLLWNRGNGAMRFGTNDSERARLTSDGHFLVGKTSGPNYNVVGVDITRLGEGQFTVNNGEVLQLNRQSSDGTIVNLRKDGSSIGSLSTKSDDLVIHSSITNHSGLSFSDGSILPTNNYGTTSTNTVDLGSSSRKFKDMWLAGQVYVPTLTGVTTINTASSTGVLEIYGGATNKGGKIVLSGGNNTSDGSDIRFHTGASTANPSERARITSDGKFGLGLTNPSERLEVNGNISFSGSASIQPNGTNTNLTIGTSSSGSSGLLKLLSTGDIELFQYGSSWTTNVTFKADGNVGLGVAPSSVLHVAGRNTARNTIVPNVTIDGGTSAANPYDGFGFGIDFVGRDYSSTHRNYAAIYSVMEGTTNTNAGGDVGFTAGLRFYTNTGGAANTAPTEKLRLTASGNVGIGVVPSALVMPDGSTGALQFQQGGVLSAYAGAFHISQNWYYNSGEKYIANGYASRYYQKDGNHVWETAGNNTSGAGAGATLSEHMRLNNLGQLLINTSTVPDANNSGFLFTTDQLYTSAGANTAYNYQVRFYNGNGLVGSIATLNSGTIYNTASDQRLKENIQNADDAGSKVDAIQVRKFDWKADGSHQKYGMIAQELIEVAPEAVSAPEDPEDMMGVDYSKLVPMLIKEIQQLRKRVKDLEE